MTRGWWTLSVEMEDDELATPRTALDDIDRDHIAQCIIDGYSSGEILHEDENDLTYNL